MRHVVFASVLTVLVAASAVAQTNAACWNRSIERMDYILNPPDGGDNEFFTAVAQETAVGIVFMNRKKMLELPYSMYEIRQLGGPIPTGCTNAFLNSLTYFYPDEPSLQGKYASTKQYPAPEKAFAGDNAFRNKFDNTKYYRYLEWTKDSGTARTAASACSLFGTNAAACEACVTTSGYWLNPLASAHDNTANAGVFAGNWLNFFPTRDVLLRLALKSIVNKEASILPNRLAVVHNADGNGMEGFTGSSGSRSFQPSCSGQGSPTTALLQGANDINFDQNANPIGEVLFNMGQHFSRKGRYQAIFNNTAAWNAAYDEGSGNNTSMCRDCARNFVILFSDGRGDEGNPWCVRNALGVLPPYCTAEAQCANEGMGAEDDGDDYIRASVIPSVTGPTSRQTPPNTCDREYADDVARFLYNADLNVDSNFPSKNNITTFVVGVGSASYNRLTTLRAIAEAGGGSFVQATDYANLRQGIKNILLEINKRATSFAVAAVTTVQTRGTTYAFIPRFRPAAENRWEGHLFRFKLFNEFAAGCTSADYGRKVINRNPDGNSDCNGVYLQDLYNRFVGEDSDGEFRVLDVTQNYPWPLTNTPATPVWDAASELARRDLVLDARQIYTVLDLDGDGLFEPEEQTPFSVANVASITPYLALGGVNGAFCQELSIRTGNTYLNEETCAADVIKFVHGIDVMDEDADGDRNDNRPKLLADIFHSAPILVTPPVPKFLCDLGVSTQCTFSLYSSRLTPGGESYVTYAANQGKRMQVVLVGSNGGMLHAFHASSWVTGDDPDTSVVENEHFNLGSGRELWAFIPPDLLPKLKRYVATNNRHEMFVDGTPMVRDVWYDFNGDRKKQVNEFRTIAIVGERQGGRHYFALDVTDPGQPRFRWTWPPVASTWEMVMGETWNDYAPAAPPIGAIAVKDAPNGPLTVGGVKASERYAVFLNGGYDANFVRGRAVSALDAWTGQELWSFARAKATGCPASVNSNTIVSDPQCMLFPVAAPIALLDVGPTADATNSQDGLFDTAVFGDLAGNVWTLRFYSPGEDTSGDGLFDNWFGARAFTQYRDASASLRERSAFYQLASAAMLMDTGNVRVYLGAGDRANIRDLNGGDCGLSNLGACIRKDCAVDVNNVAYKSGTRFFHGQWKYDRGAYDATVNSYASSGFGSPVIAPYSCADAASGDFTVTINCGSANTYQYKADCRWEEGTECRVEQVKPVLTKVDKTYTPNRASLFSIRLFGGGDGPRPAFNTLADAQRYDQNRLALTQLVDADGASLSSSSGNGYYVTYADVNERTASGASILAGCVLWNTLTPAPRPANSCGLVIGDAGKTYRAHYITGSKTCAQVDPGLPRAQAPRMSIAPPPPPTPVVSVNPVTGEVRYSVIQLDPGAPPVQTSLSQSEVMGTIHWLEVSRPVHECRHGSGGCK